MVFIGVFVGCALIYTIFTRWSNREKGEADAMDIVVANEEEPDEIIQSQSDTPVSKEDLADSFLMWPHK